MPSRWRLSMIPRSNCAIEPTLRNSRPVGRPGIDPHVEDPQCHSLFFEQLADLGEVRDGTRQAVELGHDERVAFAQVFGCPAELDAFADGADFLGKDLFGALFRQRSRWASRPFSWCRVEVRA